MEVDENWRDKPITIKQTEFLCSLARKSFNHLTRGEASDLIERWHVDDQDELEKLNESRYSQDVLEDNK